MYSAYVPGTMEGYALLAHELVHVGQWRTQPDVGPKTYALNFHEYEDPAYAMQVKVKRELRYKAMQGWCL
jgi:hypothetical protein